MSTFNFDSDKIKTSESIFATIADSYYPEGQVLVKNTSASASGVSRERTLTSRSLADAITGDALFRSPKFALTFYNKSLSSSLNSVITGGSEAAFTTASNYVIDDPENPDGKAKLTGGVAFSRTIIDSIAGRRAGSDYIDRAARSIRNDYTTMVSYPPSSMNTASNHTSPDVPIGNMSMGGRTAVLESSINAQELVWLKERAKVLYDFGTVADRGNGLLNGFNFDVPNDLTDISLTGTHYPGIENVNKLSDTLIKADIQKIYVSPTLIELLIYLNQKIVIKGGFGFQRGTVSQGSNNSGLKSGEYLTDHALGRAFDITGIGIVGGEFYDIWNKGPSNIDIYRKGLELFFNTLSAAPAHLIPDFFKVSDLMTNELALAGSEGSDGFKNSYEEPTSPIKLKYPGLRYCNIDSDSSHRNHIHISINSSRAGYYTGPGGQIGSGTPGNVVVTVPGETRPPEAVGGLAAQGLGAESVDIVETVPGELRPTTSLTGTPATGASSSTNFLANPGFSTSSGFLAYVKWLRSQNPFAPKSIAQTGINPDTGLVITGEIVIPSSLNTATFTKSYAGDQGSALTLGEVYSLLRLTGFNDEMAAIFTAIAQRESNLRPGAYNINRNSGDWSIGMWQLNMLPRGLGRMQLWLPLPSTKSYYGWQLGFKDWQSTNFGVEISDNVSSEEQDQFESVLWEKVSQVESGSKYTLIDPAFFYPLNQVYALYNVLTGQELKDQKLGQVPEYRFRPWGDYGGGPPYGFISNVRFDTIADLYVSSGKPLATIQNWVIQMFRGPGKDSKSAEYAEDWVNGWFFPVEWSSGWVQKDPVAPGQSE